MADTMGSQASEEAAKAAAAAEDTAKAAVNDVKKVVDDSADAVAKAATGAVEGAKQAASEAVDKATGAVAGAAKAAVPVVKPAGPPPVAKPGGPPPVAKPAGPPPVAKAGGPPPVAKSAGSTSAAPTVAKPVAAAAAPAPKKEEVVAAPPKGVTRREFLNYVWGSSMALFLAQFGGITFLFSMPRFRAGEFGGTIAVRAADFPALNQPPVANNAGKFWLVQTDAGINTLYKICTHLGCIYPWSDASSIFACPCHGSQFQLDGTYIAGPAARSLDRFTFVVKDASGAVLGESKDGQPIPMPANADIVEVNTGDKKLGKSNF